MNSHRATSSHLEAISPNMPPISFGKPQFHPSSISPCSDSAAPPNLHTHFEPPSSHPPAGANARSDGAIGWYSRHNPLLAPHHHRLQEGVPYRYHAPPTDEREPIANDPSAHDRRCIPFGSATTIGRGCDIPSPGMGRVRCRE